MKMLILSNGDYGEPAWYRNQASGFSRIICADGAAKMACTIGITPDLVVGDMDSIPADDRERLTQEGSQFIVYPPEKDLTDTQIAYELAREEGASSVTVWGGVGSRLDHTLSTICNAFSLVECGIDVCFTSPVVSIHLVKGARVLRGEVGDTVSLIVLTDEACGVTLKGFRYPLVDATIEGRWQCCVSNVMTVNKALIEVASGNVAVFHYHRLPD
ncbi:MAG TPA: thiamine diphosphokinase [Deltaproteobacteria bacterium]|nr:thiamine diphosphokinase [Deltaproteobacteria bacterium]